MNENGACRRTADRRDTLKTVPFDRHWPAEHPPAQSSPQIRARRPTCSVAKTGAAHVWSLHHRQPRPRHRSCVGKPAPTCRRLADLRRHRRPPSDPTWRDQDHRQRLELDRCSAKYSTLPGSLRNRFAIRNLEHRLQAAIVPRLIIIGEARARLRQKRSIETRPRRDREVITSTGLTAG